MEPSDKAVWNTVASLGRSTDFSKNLEEPTPLIFISCQQKVLSKFLTEDINVLRIICSKLFWTACQLVWNLGQAPCLPKVNHLAWNSQQEIWIFVLATFGNSWLYHRQFSLAAWDSEPYFPKVDKCGPLNDFTLSCNPKSGRNKHSEVSVMVTLNHVIL